MPPDQSLRDILNALSGPALVIGPDGRILLENERTAALLHPSDTGDVGVRRTAELNNLLLSSLMNRGTDGELHLVHPSDGARIFAASSAPLPSATAGEGARLWTLQDVTESRRTCNELEVRVERQARELESANRLKSEFLASMSHELRTPINALLGYTALLRDRVYGDLTRGQEAALDRVSNASEHLLELVSDILDLARLQGGGLTVQPEPVDLAELIHDVAHAVEPNLRAKQLEFQVEIQPELPRVTTDRARLRQVLMQLLSNAIKFTPRGSVAVEARRAKRGGGVEIVVSDTGIGIRPEHLSTIWEEFRQVDQTWTREHEGTGLGLAIAKQMLDVLGGNVRVRSRPGHGSVFTVTLPLRSKNE